MKVSLPGLLKHAANTCKTNSTAVIAGSLLEMLEHLRQLRADPSRLQEFMDLYVDEGFATWLAEHPEHAAKAPTHEFMLEVLAIIKSEINTADGAIAGGISKDVARGVAWMGIKSRLTSKFKKPVIKPAEFLAALAEAPPIDNRPYCAVCGEVLCSKPACQPKDY